MTAHDDAHLPTRADIIDATGKPVSRAVTLLCAVMAALGAVIFAIGALTGNDRAWQALHVNWLFFATISQAGVIFVAVQRITTARWSRPIVRLLEGYVAFLPAAFLLLALLFLGRHHVFSWAMTTPTVAEKRTWLAPAWVAGRDLVLFALLAGLSLWYIYRSVRLDVGLLPEGGAAWARGLRARMRQGFRDERREIHSTHSMQGVLAVVMCVCFGFFYTMLAWDLSMSMDLHFQSALYGWWFFMGAWLGALMSWSLLTIAWRRHLNVYDLITEHHLHDLGKLCFAFTAFWGYFTFGQYLVIWYGNMGEETHWFHQRLSGPWLGTTLAVVFLMFVLPFFGLVSRAAKVFLPTFIGFALCSLAGLWLLRYTEVYPAIHTAATSLPLGLWELGVFVGYLGLWGLCYSGFMNAFPRMRTTLMTSPFRDEVQIPVNPDTMEPLPAHE